MNFVFLANDPYREILLPELFNLEYIDDIVDRYVCGEQITGANFNIPSSPV